MRDIITKLEQLNEGHMSDMAHEVEKDHEVQMARSDLYKAAKYAVSIHKMMKDVSEMEGIDGWVASKITKASDYLGSVKHYMEGQMMQDVELAVVPVAGDMTDAMDVPQESIEEVNESQDVVEGRLGFRDIAKFGHEIAMRIDIEARRRGSADMEPGDADELRYRIAREMGLVESEENLEELTKAQQDRIDAAPGRTIDDMKPAERDSLKKFVKNTPQNTSKPAQDFYKKMGYDKLAKEDTVEEEDVIGNIIGKLAQGKAGQRGGKDVIGDIIAKLPKTPQDPKTPRNQPKPDVQPASPTVPMQAKQKMANKMALPKSKPDMSMGQDKTTGDPRGILRQSKFSEWSKK
tara:strand:- start:883 stop:1926 length:1044 start_codon:yes stop_codon:yes gene_type:complete